jgi:hypothetical protein
MKFKRMLIGGDTLVVAFDICSSSDIQEELILRHELAPYNKLIEKLKHYLAEAQEWVAFEPYKFTGDGWILLFPASTAGESLWKFMCGLSDCYDRASAHFLLPRLNTRPSTTGLTFGVERGQIAKMTMFQQAEYIGRPITVACRLQSAVKSVTTAPGYKALVSASAFADYLAPLGLVAGRTRNVPLRNVRDGRAFRCKLIRTPLSTRLNPEDRSATASAATPG